ncbi:MAG: tetrahydromethanopterin S-methyltransferase subunit H [Euryarchaeota archaeon]
MFYFPGKEQKVVDICGVKVGGQPGEYPTVLAGTMFYAGHEIVKDEEKGEFDEERAEELIKMEEELADETGNPMMAHIMAESEEAMIRYLDWVADVTDAPIIVDSTEANVKIAAVKHAQEVGLAERIVYNSINASAEDEEIQAIKESDCNSAIVLAFNPMDSSIEGRLKILTEGEEGVSEQGMLEIADECGIENPLIDTAATPFGSGAGQSVKAVIAVKAKLGLPVGGAPHNIPSAWDWMRELRKKLREEGREDWAKMMWESVDWGSNILENILGADYLLFGPIENAPAIWAAAAMIDALIAEANEDIGIEPQVEDHPANIVR